MLWQCYFNSWHSSQKRAAELVGNHPIINHFSNSADPSIALYSLLETCYKTWSGDGKKWQQDSFEKYTHYTGVLNGYNETLIMLFFSCSFLTFTDLQGHLWCFPILIKIFYFLKMLVSESLQKLILIK